MSIKYFAEKGPAISDVLSHAVTPENELGNCSAGHVEYNPNGETPAREVVSNGGSTLPEGTMLFEQVYDDQGDLLSETPRTNWDGSHDA